MPTRLFSRWNWGDFALGLGGMGLELIQFSGKPVGNSQRALIAGPQVELKVFVDDPLGDQAGLYRVGVSIVDFNQVGIRNRNDLQVGSQNA